MGDVITKLEIITRKTKFQELKDALNEIGVMGMTVTQVLGCGTQKGEMQYYRGVCEKVLRTGEIGDGKIFIYDVKEVVKIRTGDRGLKALQDD